MTGFEGSSRFETTHAGPKQGHIKLSTIIFDLSDCGQFVPNHARAPLQPSHAGVFRHVGWAGTTMVRDI